MCSSLEVTPAWLTLVTVGTHMNVGSSPGCGISVGYLTHCAVCELVAVVVQVSGMKIN